MNKSSTMKITNLCYLLLILQCISTVVQCKRTNYIVTTFPNPRPQETFINMVRDVGSGKIFVAAVNYLYKFSPDLILEQQAVTGPKEDNPNCLPPKRGVFQSCRFPVSLRENYNKALLIMDNAEESKKRLISCSTLFHGYCVKRWLSNISRTDEIVYKPVVANNRTATTVVFIGPGPTRNNVMTNALYVGASWTNTGLSGVRDLVKAFSSRSLDNFRLNLDTIQYQSGKTIETLHRQSFPIYYIYGVSTEIFSYVVTVQKSSTASKAEFISKLIRVCNEDDKFRSYTEVELQCNYKGVNYNLAQVMYMFKPGTVLAEALGVDLTEDVLFGVFSRGSPHQATSNARESVMCIYPMKEVRRMFTENIRKCFNGTGMTGPDYIVKPIKCASSPYLKDIDDGYCGTQDFNTPINGQDPIVGNAALIINKAITSIIVTTTHKYTVAFLGTQDGHIIKVAISSQEVAEAYEEVVIEEGNAIRKNMYFDTDQHHLYAFTDTMIYKIVVKDCSQYKTCDTCLGIRDSYCGWCSLEDKCSVVSECKNHDHDLHWLEYSSQTCPNITHVIPDKIQRDNSKTTKLTLNISNLPMFTGNFKCAFIKGNTRVLTDANLTLTTNSITCNTPPAYSVPEFPSGADHIVMQLSVLMNGIEFVSTNFTIFDCEVHTKDACYRCTASNFNCTWCIQNHICTNSPLEDCSTNDKFISGSKSEGLMLPNEPGPNYCPTFMSKKLSITDGVQNILVPSSTSKKVSLIGKNIRDFQKPLHCVFSLGGEEQRVLAMVAEVVTGVKVIECTNFYFYYPDNVSYLNVPLKVEWGAGNKPLDNPSHLQIKMYKCEKMAGSCGECLVMDSGYNCGWCNSDQESKKCSIRKNCPFDNSWLSATETCPNPRILKIRPLTGPKQGGTELTIDGLDLGKTFDDIVSNVDVFGIQCHPIRDKYIPAMRIVCRTDVFHNKDRTTGPVRVTVNSRYPSESKEHFTYVNPVIESIQPSHGPQAGGTRVTINGQYMNAGTNITAKIGGRVCSSYKESKSSNQFVCVTPSSPKVTSAAEVKMWFDNQLVTSDQYFDYVDNPVIEEVNPKKSIRSGGVTITVTGQNLDSVKNPKMVILADTATFEGDCNPGNAEMFTCLSPMIDPQIFSSRKRRDVSMPTARIFHYGFRMDNVTDLLNLTKYDEKQFKSFSIYPDPTFEQFPGNKIKSFQKKNNEYLTISGQYLSSGIRQSDMMVKIGRGYCNVTSVGNQLTCQPPKSQPQSDKGNRYPEVEIYIGNNLTIFIGYLKYEEAKFPLPLEYIILIAAGGGVLFICIIVVIIMYRFKSKKNDSMMKKMQIQMDNLEAKVAKECKEAFAELQTDMTELTSDLYGQVAIPFWDYRTYCMRVLFPKQDALDQDVDHPVIRDLEVDYARRESVERGLKQFAQMLNNKTFLLIFVRTLEGHKHFTMRDRVNVASLISVALQTKMEYATDILKTLLAELIEKSVEGKNHPKLLLRRTESVAEKMLTNWFTFLLYKFLRECAGEPLFMLYQAMKQQVSKGPVDNVTSEARYSLSEDKLIRQQIEYKQMTVYVQDMEQFGQQPHPVKVLDCDTIAQVKEKILDAIYKNAPFSSRPIKDDVDLVLFDKSSPEWNSGIKGRLILQDDDVSTKIEGEYKRLNSCSHYKVPDGAFMTLVPKQPQSYYNMSMNSNDKSGSKLYSDLIYSRSPSLNRTPQGFHADTDGSGYKYYHLVKQHDAETMKEGDRGSKMVSEIYLTRLLATKGTLQQFVDDLFERIFSTNHRCTALPLAIKYMFDFLDDQALQHGIQDTEVVHTWKSNSLPLRFWVNVIKNPNFVFDIYKSPIVDSCLSVVAQTFMDSCSMSEHRLGKDSPSSKLLYAKDIPKYKKWVERYYQDIKMMPAISDQDMTAMMTDESRCHQDEFNTSAALLELYKYVQKYNEELWQALEEDEFAKKNRLTYKLEQVRMTMEAEVYC